MTKSQTGEERVSLAYPSILLLIFEDRAGAQTGQKSEAGAGAEDMEAFCLLTCSTWLAQHAFL